MIVPPEYVDEYARCAADKWYFIKNYIKISDPELGIIPMVQWPHLYQLIRIIDENDRVIVLKARQIGITWLVCSIALWYALFRHSSLVIFFSRRETESTGMKNRVVFMHGLLPEWLKIPIGKNNDELVEFPIMNSAIKSFPATEGSARSDNASIIFLDEWAFQEHAEVNFTGLLPSIEHGKLVGLSTANGKGGIGKQFADTWFAAKAKLNSFVPVFIPYTVRPGRDEAWHKKQEADMPAHKAWQEYPLNEVDAFIVAGTCMFSIDILRGMPKRSPSRSLGPAQIWVEYNPDHKYVAGIDTALGIAGRDYSVLQIIDVTLGVQAAKIHTQMPIEEFSVEALKLLSMYHFPMVNIEEQPQGRLVVKTFMDGTEAFGRYPRHRIYHRSKNIPCWHTTHDNRQEILSELEIAVRKGYFYLFSESSVDEMLGFGYNEDTNKFEGMSGNDDEVMSLALGWHMACEQPKTVGDLTPRSYVDDRGHRKGQPVQHVDWGKKNPFEDMETLICWTCEGIPDDQRNCRTCRASGKVLVYAKD